MKFNKNIIFYAVSILPFITKAETFILNCVLQDTKNKGVSAAYIVNTTKKTVIYDNSSAFNVEITDLKIKFTEAQNGKNWTSIISRADGTMRTYKQDEPDGLTVNSLCKKIPVKLF
jgi:hypothetical protein